MATRSAVLVLLLLCPVGSLRIQEDKPDNGWQQQAAAKQNGLMKKITEAQKHFKENTEAVQRELQKQQKKGSSIADAFSKKAARQQEKLQKFHSSLAETEPVGANWQQQAAQAQQDLVKKMGQVQRDFEKSVRQSNAQLMKEQGAKSQPATDFAKEAKEAAKKLSKGFSLIAEEDPAKASINNQAAEMQKRIERQYANAQKELQKQIKDTNLASQKKVESLKKTMDNYAKVGKRQTEKIQALHADAQLHSSFLEGPAGIDFGKQAAKMQKDFVETLVKAKRDIEKQSKDAQESLIKQQDAAATFKNDFEKTTQKEADHLAKKSSK